MLAIPFIPNKIIALDMDFSHSTSVRQCKTFVKRIEFVLYAPPAGPSSNFIYSIMITSPSLSVLYIILCCLQYSTSLSIVSDSG